MVVLVNWGDEVLSIILMNMWKLSFMGNISFGHCLQVWNILPRYFPSEYLPVQI